MNKFLSELNEEKVKNKVGEMIVNFKDDLKIIIDSLECDEAVVIDVFMYAYFINLHVGLKGLILAYKYNNHMNYLILEEIEKKLKFILDDLKKGSI